MDLRNKNIVITGAANGIGKCLARQLHAKGANLFLIDLDAINLTRLVKELGCVGLACDVREFLDITMAVQNEMGRADILINNAGIGDSTYLSELQEINFWAPYRLVNSMKGLKRVVNVSSGQVFFKLPSWGKYAATKAALSTWSETLGFESKDLHVLTVYPFMTDTGFYKGIEQDTWAGKMSMKLLPYYSQSPETVAKKIVRAIERDKRVEMVHPINYVGKAIDAIPGLRTVVGTLAAKLLCK